MMANATQRVSPALCFVSLASYILKPRNSTSHPPESISPFISGQRPLAVQFRPCSQLLGQLKLESPTLQQCGCLGQQRGLYDSEKRHSTKKTDNHSTSGKCSSPNSR